MNLKEHTFSEKSLRGKKGRDGQNWYIYVRNNPLGFVDPTGLEIMRHNAFYNMSRYRKDDISLGNSKTVGDKQAIKVHEQGCYITALSNILSSIELLGFRSPSKSIANTDPIDLNSRKNIFAENSANLDGRDNSMNAIFGEGKWDYWTREKQKVEGIKKKLEEYQNSDGKYMIVGVFDLSNATAAARNHMVGLNGLPDENGVFNTSDIVPSSDGDVNRLSDETKKKEYNLNNLKEIRIISLPQKSPEE